MRERDERVRCEPRCGGTDCPLSVGVRERPEQADAERLDPSGDQHLDRLVDIGVFGCYEDRARESVRSRMPLISERGTIGGSLSVSIGLRFSSSVSPDQRP